MAKNKQNTQKPQPKKATKEEELTNLLKKVQADFENYKKRVEKERAEFAQYAAEEFTKSLLPLLDSFELALKNCSDKKDFIKGIELIYAQFTSLLESNGIKKIDALGKKFDPYYHEALLKEESDKEDGVILEELQKGYMFKDHVLRYSKVKIAKNGNNKANTSKQSP